MESTFLDQITRLGNSQFKEGSILSGMSVVPKGKVGDGGIDSKGNASLISLSTLQAQNSKIDTTNYLDGGQIGVKTTSISLSDYPGLKMSIGATKGDITLSFSVTQDSGNLYKLSGIFDKSLTVSKYTIDGKAVHSGFDDYTTAALKDSKGNQINLADGKAHDFAITFTGANNTTYPIIVQANAGYNALNEGAVNFTLKALKAEAGDTVTDWKPNANDNDASTGKNRNNKLTITEGYIYLGGIVRYFAGQDINVTNSGTETLGVTIDENILKSSDDSSLLDHTPGTLSQFKPGADRLKYVVSLTYNDKTSPTIYTLFNGNLTNNAQKPVSATLNDILAKRTNDESGSYAVDGFNLWSEKDTTDGSVVDVYVDSGTAYVQGYQIIKNTSTKLQVPKATGTADMKDEVFIYSDNSPIAELQNQPVKRVNQVSGNVQINDEQVTRSQTTSNHDALNKQAYEIDEVYSKDSKGVKTYYKMGTDFNLVNGNELEWDVTDSAKNPIAGGTYYVTYKYQKVFVKDADYTVPVTGEQQDQTTSISFDGMSGDKPVNNSQVHVAYTYFLARVDVITLDKNANFNIVTGQQDKLSTVTPPNQIDPMTLQMGYVTVFPNSDKAITQKQTVTRIPFTGLQDMVSRLNDLEYNLSVSELRYQSMANQDPITMKNTFSDDFSNLDKADTGNKMFSAQYIPAESAITVSNKVSGELPMSVDTADSRISESKHMAMAPFSEFQYISQPLATDAININPYDVFNVLGDMNLNPEVDNWIENNVATNNVDGGTVNSGPNYLSYFDMDKAMTAGGWTLDADDSENNLHISSYQTSNDGFIHHYFKANTTKDQSDTLIEYMRQRNVDFVVSNLIALDNNLELTFDGQHADITPAKGYNAGTNKGTIRSDGNGTAKGTFTIPANVRCGTREVKLSNGHDTAISNYTAKGTLHTDITTITREHATASYYDPLAQSFATDKNGILTSVNLYFAAMPKAYQVARSSVKVQIRKMDDGGYPNRTIVAEGELSPADVKTSSDGSIATNVVFKDPLIVKAGDSYALCLITDSDAYEVYTAVIGHARLDNKGSLGSPAYNEGTFFTSTNAQTWTAQQDTSLKFDMNAAIFADSGILQYQPVDVASSYFVDGTGKQILDDNDKPIKVNPSQLLLLANYATPNNSSIAWEFRQVTQGQPLNVSITDMAWQPITPNQTFSCSAQLRTFQIRATLHAKDGISPMIALDSLSLGTFLTGDEGVYLSRDVNMGATPYNHIRTTYEAYVPDGSSVTPMFSTDKGKTWRDYSQAYLKTTKIDRQYVQYAFDWQIHNPSKSDQKKESNFKIRLALTTNSAYAQPKVRRLLNSMSLQDGNENGNDGWTAPSDNANTPNGTILWSDNSVTPAENPSVTLSKPLSSLVGGIKIKAIDKFDAIHTIVIANKDLITGHPYTATFDSLPLSVSKDADNKLTISGLKGIYPFEIEASSSRDATPS